MNPTDKTSPAQYETLSFAFDLRHPPEKVWQALTDPDLLAQWLLPVIDLKLEPGARFNFMAPPQPGWDGVVHCRLLEIEPYRKLRYAWVVGELDTEVTFVLTPNESGTRLSLDHSGFRTDQKKNFGGARYGWRMMGEKLVALLDDVP